MGTKNNPGEHDCYSKAGPDEPMFVLLARDELAPELLRIWARWYKQAKLSIHGALDNRQTRKYEEALTLAHEMEQWFREREVDLVPVEEGDVVWTREEFERKMLSDAEGHAVYSDGKRKKSGMSSKDWVYPSMRHRMDRSWSHVVWYER